jgi:hypothetical protein
MRCVSGDVLGPIANRPHYIKGIVGSFSDSALNRVITAFVHARANLSRSSPSKMVLNVKHDDARKVGTPARASLIPELPHGRHHDFVHEVRRCHDDLSRCCRLSWADA